MARETERHESALGKTIELKEPATIQGTPAMSTPPMFWLQRLAIKRMPGSRGGRRRPSGRDWLLTQERERRDKGESGMAPLSIPATLDRSSAVPLAKAI